MYTWTNKISEGILRKVMDGVRVWNEKSLDVRVNEYLLDFFSK